MPATISFGKGFVYRRNWLYVTGSWDELDEQDVAHTLVFRWLDGEWGHWTIDQRIVSLCVYDAPKGRTVLSMSFDGAIEVRDDTGQRWEVVDEGDNGPSNLRHLTAMRMIGESVYVAGMRRQVYCRPLSGGAWKRVDKGTFVPLDRPEVTGFKAIDGLHEKDIYASGFFGEIWHWDGMAWAQLDSPTNVLLPSLKCVAPEIVYVAGVKGVVLRGDKNGWQAIANEATQDTFWGIEYYDGTLYLATGQGSLYKLDKEEIVPLELNLDKPFTTGWLHAHDGVLFSVGSRDLLLFDGNTWREIVMPPGPPDSQG